MRYAGPLCGWEFGPDWIDAGTLARTRTTAPAARGKTPVHSTRRRHAVRLTAAQREAIERQLLDVARKDGMSDITEQAMFLAQVAHESDGFTRLHENLAYSATRLRAVFPKRFPTDTEAAAAVAAGQDAIAERLYGHRKQLGNTRDGDGARYRGRGYIQLTGRANYAAAGTALGLALVDHPELAEVPEQAGRIAVWFWMRDLDLRAAGQRGNVEAATRRVNGGVIGLQDRRARFEHYLAWLRSQQVSDSARTQRPVPPLP
ncbi:MAG: lytic enzyme [Ramlibacter sp.]|nr:lytic enzyme [Ramlibacter sp.]